MLGSLLEKEVTVPASYPMTVNAVRTACNQASSREPAVDYDERLVHDTLRELKARDLVAVTWEDRGRRTLKYVQTVAARQGWADDERALLTVLLLRGPQPPGALKTRTERLHAFADRDDVEATLTRMAAAEPPLVRQLPRGVREHDARWVHLLGPVETGSVPVTSPPSTATPCSPGEPTPGTTRSARPTPPSPPTTPTTSWGARAPAVRALAARPGRGGAGSGGRGGLRAGPRDGVPAGRGADATGIDLTPAMVEEARRRFPEGRYEVGDLAA